MSSLYTDRILILDFGSQFTQLIARRIREIGVYSEIYSCDISLQDIEAFAPTGIVLSGGPNSVYAPDALTLPEGLLDADYPILAICYGMQALASALGAEVHAATQHEYGYAQIRARGHTPLLNGIMDRENAQGHGLLDVWMSHGDQVASLPEGFCLMASTDNCPIAGMANIDQKIYAIQFHPEVTHTKQGEAIIRRFVVDICGCRIQWQTAHITDSIIEKLRQKIGKKRVLLALSGGVDSSVAALLLHKAIGEQLHCVFVDNGLLRLNEGDDVMMLFSDHLGLQVQRVNAQNRFLDALGQAENPEEKRKIIGHAFINVFEEVAKSHKQPPQYLAQGTIYPDVIESAASKHGKAQVIKSHHNVGGLPETLGLDLVEPLRELFKDEVRKIGLHLGLSKTMLYRHPFPGPGLGVRILGAIKAEYADILRKADAIFIEELHRAEYYTKLAQAFVVFLPVKSVGVVGDQRRYGYVVALRAVTTTDFMTANWADLPTALIATVSNRIINEIPDISRVVYDVSSKPPATIEWE